LRQREPYAHLAQVQARWAYRNHTA
jgi:hypothetical protein